jgi:putative heme-binding domain-containing protein
LIEAVTTRQTSPQILQNRAIRDRLLAAKLPDTEARLALLTQNLPPANDAVNRLIAQRRNAHGATAADSKQGQILFEQVCAVCHQIGGQGGLVGPQLDGIGNRGIDRLIEDIVDPNRNVDLAFRMTVLTLADDSVVSGLLRRREGEQIVLADSAGNEIFVPTRQVKSQRESETSLMPENLGELYSTEDFNHLMAFLLSKSGR